MSAEQLIPSGAVPKNGPISHQRYISHNPVLAACSLLLLFIILYFVVYNLKCFEKKSPMPEKEVPPVWKEAKYEDHKCNICEQYGAVIETYCRHYFHL